MVVRVPQFVEFYGCLRAGLELRYRDVAQGAGDEVRLPVQQHEEPLRSVDVIRACAVRVDGTARQRVENGHCQPELVFG